MQNAWKCGRTYTLQKVRRFYCDHFNLVLKFIISNGLKVQVTTSCNKCFKEYNSELKLGCLDAHHNLITYDVYTSQCCGNKIDLNMSLSEQYIEQNEPEENYRAPNYNNMDSLLIYKERQ